MGSDALPLWFDSRFGRKRNTGTGVRRRGVHLTRGDRLKLALLFEVMKGRNGRGDDHSRLDRLEVSLGAG
jgi:hypothetical protein